MPLPLLALAPILAGLAAGGSIAYRNLEERGKMPEGIPNPFGPSPLAEIVGGSTVRDTPRSPGSSAYRDAPYSYSGSGAGRGIADRLAASLAANNAPVDNRRAPSYQEFLNLLGMSPDMLQAQLQSTIGGNNAVQNLLGNPRDMTQDWLAQLDEVYAGPVGYAQSVIPYLEQQGANAKGEVVDLYNIAEAGLEEDSANTRSAGMEAATTQANNIAEIVNAINAGAQESESDYLADLESLGLSTEGRDEISQMGAEQAGLVGEEGALYNNAMAEGSNATADYLQELASIQDTAAAAQVAELSNVMADLIFQQQGRITDLQSQQAAAALDIMMKGRSDYLSQIGMYADAQNQGVGNFIDMANLVRGLYGDYAGYGFEGDRISMEMDQLYGGLGEGAEPVEGYEGAIQRASGGDPSVASALRSAAGAAVQSITQGQVTVAISQLESAGVPSDAATSFVMEMLAEYG